MMDPLILIVDDDASIRHTTADILEDEGYQVATASNVAEGITQLAQLKPDLVLCDVMLPDGNGYDVFDALQKTDRAMMTPFIFMSGEAILAGDIRKGMHSGADDYLIKPFHLQDLLTSIQVRLARQRQFQDIQKQFETAHLPPFLVGAEQELLTLLESTPPPFLLVLGLNQYERFQRLFGRERARLLCYSVFQRLKQLPVLAPFHFYASENDAHIYLVPQTQDEVTPLILNQLIQKALAEPVPFERYQLHVQVSLGLANKDTTQPLTPPQWLERCHLALYHAHSQGGGALVVYHSQMEQKLHDRLHWESELQLALATERFELYYQPQFELKSLHIIGIEALLRLNHPEFGLIPPGDFIPVAEDSGLIVPIGAWVLRRACQVLHDLQQKGYGYLRMAVNVSLLQFQSPHFAELVTQTLAETDITGEQLELELTESLLIDNFRQVEQLLKTLKNTGLTLAVDDFGTGYSSLFYLNQLPFDTLKIDQAFVRTMNREDTFTQAIPRAIIEMGHGMGMQVLAEGIETEEQMQLLRELGCNNGQGFYIARPMPESALLDLLHSENT